MRQYIDEIISLAEAWPAKISVSSISLLISESLGGGDWMLKAVQYLAFTDLCLQILTALCNRRLTVETFVKGTSKIVSLYIALIIMGIGTHAIDVAAGGIPFFEVSGTALYDLFIFYLIAGELVSINSRCASLGLPINKQLTTYLRAFNSTIERKLKEFISREK